MIRFIVKKYFFIAIFIMLHYGVSAQDYLHNIEHGEINGYPSHHGISDSGIDVTIIEISPLDDSERITRIEDIIDSFAVIPIHSARITHKLEGLSEIFLTAAPFEYNGYKLSENLSSGFTLILDGGRDFKVDLFVNKLSIHLEGFYKDEKDFLDRLIRIIRNPAEFMMSRDPEFILKTFQELKEHEADLKKENETLRNELSELKYNSLIIANRSLFGSVRMIDRDMVDWIVVRKNSNPSLTAAELGQQLFSETGKKLNTKSIDLILGLYFGDFKE